MNNLTKLAMVTALTVLLASFPPGCGKPEEMKEVRRVKTNVEVWAVVPGEMVDEVTLPGIVEPVKSVTVSSEVGGKVEAISVKEGDEVSENQLLFAVEKKDFALLVEQANSRVREFEAMLREVKSGARPEELAQLRAAVESAVSAHSLAAGQAKRRRKLFEDGVIAQEQNDASQTALTAAEKRLEQAREALSLAEKGARAETIESFEARLSAAKTSLELAKRNLQKAEIRAPVAGVIDEKFVEKGELIKPGGKLFRIIAVDRVKVVVWAPERVMTRVRTGKAVRLKFEAVKGTITATISRIAFAADSATRTFKIEILLENPRIGEDRKFRVGYIASVTFTVDKVPRAIKVPVETLVLQGPRMMVYTVKQGKGGEGFVAVANDVEVGLKSRKAVQIKSGVSSGELVIVKGQRWVRDGEEVEVVNNLKGSWPW